MEAEARLYKLGCLMETGIALAFYLKKNYFLSTHFKPSSVLMEGAAPLTHVL